MSKPHIQVELDALTVAGAIATAAKVSRPWVIAGLADMWAHCFRAHTDEVSSFLITGWFSEPIGPVLEGFGFVERVNEDTWRVRGTDRYSSVSEKRRASGSKGGKTTQEKRRQASKSKVSTAGNAGEGEANEANAAFAQASDKQASSKQAATPSGAQAPLEAKVSKTEAKQAEDPRSEKSVPSGQTDFSEKGDSTSRGRKPAPSPRGGQATPRREDKNNASVDPPPKRPRLPPTPEGHYRDRDGNLRAIVQPGTPEFADAERRGDWKALGWT